MNIYLSDQCRNGIQMRQALKIRKGSITDPFGKRIPITNFEVQVGTIFYQAKEVYLYPTAAEKSKAIFL